MPAPRAARLAARKSIRPDPSLYGDPSDDSDDAQNARSTIKTTLAHRATSTERPSPPTRAVPPPHKAKRKPSRAGPDAVPDLADAVHLEHLSPRPLVVDAHLGPGPAAPPSRTKPAAAAAKRKRVDKASDDELVDPRDRNPAATKPSNAHGSTKRTKTTREPDVDRPDEPGPASHPSQASSQRKSHFIPRAAASQSTRPNKPPPKFSAVLDYSDDDSEPFLFTTNPPTPHAKGSAKRPGPTSKTTSKTKAPRIHSTTTDTDMSGVAPETEIRPPPVASTSRVKLTPPPATSVPITRHETPVQVSNRAFRDGPGTPASMGKTARRNSTGSARRGSSIGTGFTATPHPEIPDHELWMSTDPTQPAATRTRTLLSWATQRDRTKLFDGRRLTSTERVAKAAIDEFIDGICNLSIDTSVPNRTVQRPDPSLLPPHPQNVINSTLKSKLQEEYGIIDEEQTSRQTTAAVYADFSHRRLAARDATAAATAALLARGPRVDPASLVDTFDLSRPGPASFDEAIEMGRLLLDAAADVEAARDGEEALDVQIRETLEDTAHLHQLSHRLAGFTRVVSRFIETRSADNHRALASHALRGLDSTAPTVATGPPPPGSSSTSAAAAAAAAGGAGLGGVVGVVGPSSDVGGGIDPMDLLRAMSRADSVRR
ncbi:hypothetical protein JCM11491_000808 [Sporobolomyces phaffii]